MNGACGEANVPESDRHVEAIEDGDLGMLAVDQARCSWRVVPEHHQVHLVDWDESRRWDRERLAAHRDAVIVTRLSEALARNGRFATADWIQDIAMALERMRVLDGNNIGSKLRGRTARLLGSDAASQKRIRDDVKELYDVRSDIVHNRLHRLTPERIHSAFVNGFDIARQSLFKLLREGPLADWSGATGDGRRSRKPGGGRIVSGGRSLVPAERRTQYMTRGVTRSNAAQGRVASDRRTCRACRRHCSV